MSSSPSSLISPRLPGSGFRPDIQGLRAVAVLMVVAYHAGAPTPGGFLGVDVFFVISGFLVTQILLRDEEQYGTIRVRAFLGRRVRRLLPALAAMTTVTVIAGYFILPLGRPVTVATETGLYASVSLANLTLYRELDYFAPLAEENPFLHTWSLSVEEQFYLVLPLVLLAGIRVARARRWKFLAVAAAILGASWGASFILEALLDRSAVSLPGIDDGLRFAFYSPVTRAWELLSGALLALSRPLFGWRAGVSDRSRLMSAGLGVALLILASVAASADQPQIPFKVLTVLATVLLLWSEPERGSIGRVLRARPVQWIGDRSYSIYLWHWPLLVLTRNFWPGSVTADVTAVAVSIVIASASFRLIEQPLRGGGRVRRRRTAVIGSLSIIVPVAVSVAVLATPEVDPTAELGLPEPCQEESSIEGARSDACVTASSDDSDPVILLIGDSHCEGVLPALREVANRVGAQVVMQCFRGTPLVDGPDGSFAAAALSAVLRSAEELTPEAIIIANRSTRYLDSQYWTGFSDGPIDDVEEATTAWGMAVEGAVRELLGSSPNVVWLHQVPEHPGVVAAGRLRGIRQSVLPAGVVDAQRSGYVSAERRAVERSGADSLDLASAFCGSSCVNTRDGVPLYRDDNHLTLRGSLELVPLLEPVIREALAEGGRGGTTG